jgi:hypothetical protein
VKLHINNDNSVDMITVAEDAVEAKPVEHKTCETNKDAIPPPKK